ncbi:MAG TPA: MobF family relaxase [Acidimicrobiales bacterium]|nr:MobF family relaxase [Acidimicrobiales bacterium]
MLRLYKVLPAHLEYYLGVTRERTSGPFYERDGYWREPRARQADISAVVAGDRLLGLGRGVDPKTGAVLNRFQRQVQICALDATFAVPKGVSVLHALGSDRTREAIEYAQRSSVFEAMDFADRKIISVRRTTEGVRRASRALTVSQAVFEHRTSRSNDPHLHSHVLIPNLASDDEKVWSAIDLRPLYVHVGLLGSLYRSGLRHQLSRLLGVRWREIQPGWYDLEGLSPPMIRAFSQRRAEILREVANLGFASHRATEIAAGHSRSARKLVLGYDELLEIWRTRAFRLGISSARLEEMTGNRQLPGDERHHRLALEIVRIVSGRDEVKLFELLRRLADGSRIGSSVLELETSIDLAVSSRTIPLPRDLWPYGPRGSRVGERVLYQRDVKRTREISPEGRARGSFRANLGESLELRESAHF